MLKNGDVPRTSFNAVLELNEKPVDVDDVYKFLNSKIKTYSPIDGQDISKIMFGLADYFWAEKRNLSVEDLNARIRMVPSNIRFQERSGRLASVLYRYLQGAGVETEDDVLEIIEKAVYNGYESLRSADRLALDAMVRDRKYRLRDDYSDSVKRVLDKYIDKLNKGISSMNLDQILYSVETDVPIKGTLVQTRADIEGLLELAVDAESERVLTRVIETFDKGSTPQLNVYAPKVLEGAVLDGQVYTIKEVRELLIMENKKTIVSRDNPEVTLTNFELREEDGSYKKDSLGRRKGNMRLQGFDIVLNTPGMSKSITMFSKTRTIPKPAKSNIKVKIQNIGGSEVQHRLDLIADMPYSTRTNGFEKIFGLTVDQKENYKKERWYNYVKSYTYYNLGGG